jgi:hypothetical protein
MLSALPASTAGEAGISVRPGSPEPVLLRQPNAATRIHSTLIPNLNWLKPNSNWMNNRWVPVRGRSAVPSFIDADGYFFAPSSARAKNYRESIVM